MPNFLNQQEFNRYILKDYQPSSYEDFEEGDCRFPEHIRYGHIVRTRLYFLYTQIFDYLKKVNRPIKLLDMGFYPGNFIRVFKELFGDLIQCYGCGLKIDQGFQDYMTDYAVDCEYIDLDPFYREEKEKPRLKFDNDIFDIIVATEILEHLISPLELIAEGSRVLKKDGLFMITTPNVSHMGAVVKMILGRSNYERLHRSPMHLIEDEWRGHIRFYDRRELATLFADSQLQLVHHQYYTEAGWDDKKRESLEKFFHYFRKLFFIIPIYREGHFAVFKKT